MGWREQLSAGLERARVEAARAYERGKAKVDELQTEMQMDGLAKKLGYLTLDAHRGRAVDEAARVKLLLDLTRLEEELEKTKAERAEKAAAEKATKKRY
jgi:hypothetical protein